MTGFYSNLLLLWFVVLSIVMVVLLFSAHVVIRRIRKKERKYKDVYLAARRLQGDRKMFKGFVEIKKLLTDENLLYLDFVLSALTNPTDNEVYGKFWAKFQRAFPQHGVDKKAWHALTALHKIIRARINEK